MDKLGVRKNTYKTAKKPRFQPKNPQTAFFSLSPAKKPDKKSRKQE